MGKYLKLFNEMSQYQTFKGSEEYILPNVSYVENSNVVMYNPNAASASPNVVCTYNVTDISQDTKILEPYGLAYMTNMIVNGVEMEAETYYQFDTIGNHVVEFVLVDPTTIGNNSFHGCTELTSIVIPNSVTSIGYHIFYDCKSLTSVTIGKSVTSIGENAFRNCSGLSEITCLATTAPTINNNTFQYVKRDGLLKVPAGSDYNSWNWLYSGYNWTIEYI